MATRTFSGTVNASWANAANWDTKPVAADDIVIDATCDMDEDVSLITFASILVQNSATLDNSINDYDVNLSGDFTVGIATYTGGTETMNVAGQFRVSAGSAAMTTEDGHVVNLTGTNNINIKQSVSLYDLFCAGPGQTTTHANSGKATIRHELKVSGGTLAGSASGWFRLTGTGTPLVVGSSTITLMIEFKTAASGTVNVPAATYGGGLIVGSSTAALNVDWVLAGNVVVTGDFLLANTSGSAGNCVFDTAGYNITTSGDTTIGNSSSRHFSGIFYRDSTIDVAGNLVMDGAETNIAHFLDRATFQVAGDVSIGDTNSPVFTSNEATLTLDGAGAQDVDLDDVAWGHVNVTNTVGTVDFTAGFDAAQHTLVDDVTAQFLNAANYDIEELDWLGTSGNGVTVTSASAGNAFNLNVSGPVDCTYVNLKDCDASGGVRIENRLGTDSTGNVNVNFVTDGQLEVNILNEGADFDPDKIEYKPGTANSVLRLALKLVESEDFDTDGDFGPFTNVGGQSVSGGRLLIDGNTGWDVDGVYLTITMARTTPGKMRIKMVPKDAGNAVFGLAAAAALDFSDAVLKFFHQGSSTRLASLHDNEHPTIDTAVLVVDTEYQVECEWDGDKTMTIRIKGGVFGAPLREVGLIYYDNMGANIGFQINARTLATAWEFRNFRRFFGYWTDDPIIEHFIIDSGSDDTVWDLSTLFVPGGSAGKTYAWDADNTPASLSVGLYFTEANAKLESDPVGRYLKWNTKLSSGGAAQRENTIVRLLSALAAGADGGFPAASMLGGLVQCG